MKEKQTQMWIPLYVDKWIFGSTRIELEPAERGVFVDLMAFGAKDNGYIRANEITPYHHQQLSGLLNIPIELLASTIAKCLHFGKLEEPSPGIYKLSNWEKFQLSEDYKYRIETGRKPVPGSQVRQNPDCSPKNVGPIREDKIVEEKRREEKKDAPRPVHPTLLEVQAYCKERGDKVNPEKWLSHYEANGWKVGKNPMKDWKAAVRTWEHSQYNENPAKATPEPKQYRTVCPPADKILDPEDYLGKRK